MRFGEGIILRDLKPEDINSLIEFHKKSISINFPGIRPAPKNFKNNLLKWFKKEPRGINVLEKEGKVIGYMWLNTKYNSFRKKRFGLIRQLFIKEGYRGRGLAKQLVKFAEEYFKKRGANYMELKVTLINKAAISLYKKAGFKEKRVVMEKEL